MAFQACIEGAETQRAVRQAGERKSVYFKSWQRQMDWKGIKVLIILIFFCLFTFLFYVYSIPLLGPIFGPILMKLYILKYYTNLKTRKLQKNLKIPFHKVGWTKLKDLDCYTSIGVKKLNN